MFDVWFPQERAEGGPLPVGRGVQRIQTRQGQAAAAGSPDQQKRLHQVHLRTNDSETLNGPVLGLTLLERTSGFPPHRQPALLMFPAHRNPFRRAQRALPAEPAERRRAATDSARRPPLCSQPDLTLTRRPFFSTTEQR